MDRGRAIPLPYQNHPEMDVVYDQLGVYYVDEPAILEQEAVVLRQSQFPSQPSVQRVYRRVRRIVDPRRVLNTAQVGYQPISPQDARQPLPMATAYQTQVEPASVKSYYQPNVLPPHRVPASQRNYPPYMVPVHRPKVSRTIRRYGTRPSNTLAQETQINIQPVEQVHQSQTSVPYFSPKAERERKKAVEIARGQKVNLYPARRRQVPAREPVMYQSHQAQLPIRRVPQVLVNEPPASERHPTVSATVPENTTVINVGQQNLMSTNPMSKMIGSQTDQTEKPNDMPETPQRGSKKNTFEPRLNMKVQKARRYSARQKHFLLTKNWWLNEKKMRLTYRQEFPKFNSDSDPFLACHTTVTTLAPTSANLVIAHLVEFNNKVRKDTNIFTDLEVYVREFMLFISGISYHYSNTNLFPLARYPPMAADGYFPAQVDSKEEQGKYLLERYKEAVVLYQNLNPAMKRLHYFLEDNQFERIDMDWRCLADWHRAGRHIHGFFYVVKNAINRRVYLIDMFNLIIFPFYVPYGRWDENLKRGFDIVTAYNLNLAEVYKKNRKFIKSIAHKLIQPYRDIDPISVECAREEDGKLFSTCENLIVGGIKKTLRGLPPREHEVFQYADVHGLNVSFPNNKEKKAYEFSFVVNDDDSDDDEPRFERCDQMPQKTNSSEKFVEEQTVAPGDADQSRSIIEKAI